MQATQFPGTDTEKNALTVLPGFDYKLSLQTRYMSEVGHRIDFAFVPPTRLSKGLPSMHFNRNHDRTSPQPVHPTPVHEIVDDLLGSFGPRLKRNNISLETDLEPTSTHVNTKMIQSAIHALLENAIESMPHGGVLSTTLIDGKHQWEFEVADTAGIAYDPFEQCPPERRTGLLPVVIPFAGSHQLKTAYDNATELGGQIQTWDCPQGGTAHVLVIPRLRSAHNDSELPKPNSA